MGEGTTEALKQQQSLSDDDYAAIEDKILSEETKSEKDSEEEAIAAAVKANSPEQEEVAQEEETPEGEKKDGEEEATPEEEAKPEGEKDEEEPDPEKKPEEKSAEEDFEAKVTEYAEKENVTPEEARKELESIKSIVDKYNSEPDQLAKSNLHLQRAYTKSQQDLKVAQEELSAPTQQAKDISVDDFVTMLTQGEIKHKGQVVDPDSVVDAYKKEYPDLTETADDGTILRMAARDMIREFKANTEAQSAKQRAESVGQAKEKRETLISTLPEDSKKFIPEIQPVLERMSDKAVLADDFDLEDIVLWSKGKRYDADLKATAEREFKRGSEEAKIVGNKSPLSTSGGGSKGKAGTASLSQEDKTRALEMYDGQQISDEDKYKRYANLKKDGVI